MKTVILLSVMLALVYAAPPDTRFSCYECVDEMHHLGWLVRAGARPIHDYLAANYCPTTNDEEFCRDRLGWYYIGMLNAIVNHFFVDGAVHICQTMGTCDVARKYTCEECVQGLDWVQMYIEDPVVIAEYVVYLEQNFCLGESGGHGSDESAGESGGHRNYE